MYVKFSARLRRTHMSIAIVAMTRTTGTRYTAHITTTKITSNEKIEGRKQSESLTQQVP
jgi:hypothetical protein